MASEKPEATLIQQLQAARLALQTERESLVARIANIDEALGLQPAKPSLKGAKAPKTTKTPSIKESVLLAIDVGGAMTIREVQTLLNDASPKSIEAVMHSLVSSGHLAKDASTPRRFSSLGKKAKPNGAVANGS